MSCRYPTRMQDGPDREASSGLRGWLSDVYFPALVSSQADQLVRRLGDRATVDDPIFGRTTGMPALARYLEEIAGWLAKHRGAFDKVAFVTGSDRDVTEGTLSLTFEGRAVKVPVAVVAERRPGREVEIRLYYSTKPIKGTRAVRSPLLPQDDEVTVPLQVATQLDALSRGDLAAVMASFENGAILRDAAGRTHAKEDEGGPLRAYYEALCPSAGAGATGSGIEVLKGARADDGRICALEYTVVRVRGKNVAPQAGLAVYERGETGLLRAVRVYEDIDG
jgi:hypothetical protein